MPSIPVAAIDMPPDFVVRDEQTVDNLYFSIKSVGLINPITLIENPDLPGRFWIIAGRHRFLAIQRLGWEQVDCSIRSYNDVQAEMVTLSENLHRANLSPAETDKALARYAELYSVMHPEVAAVLKERQIAAKRQNLKVARQEELETIITEPPVSSAIEAVAKSQGIGKKAVRDAITRADGFSDEDRNHLEQVGLTKKRMTRLAKVEGEQKKEIINLLVAQMSYPEAMKEVLGDAYEGDPEDEVELSDEDWLKSCPIRNSTNKERFDREALTYRRLRKPRINFGVAISWGDMKTKVNASGLYTMRLMRFMETLHPRKWTVCHNCTRGTNKDGECQKCRGGGFLLG